MIMWVLFGEVSSVFLWVLGMGYVILLWHSLTLPYNYFLYVSYEKWSFQPKNIVVRLLKKRPESNIIIYGLTVNLYMKAEAFDQLYFLSQNHRQRFIMASITRVRGPCSHDLFPSTIF